MFNSFYDPPWAVACQAPLFMEFPRQEYWSGCHFFLQVTFSTQGSNPHLLHCRQIFYHWATREDHSWFTVLCWFLLNRNNSVLHIYMYIYTYTHISFHTVFYYDLSLDTKYSFLYLVGKYSRALLFIHPIYNSLHPPNYLL